MRLFYLQVITFYASIYLVIMRSFKIHTFGIEKKLSDYTILNINKKKRKNISGMMSRALARTLEPSFGFSDSFLRRHRRNEILYFRYQLAVVCRRCRIMNVE